MPFLSEENILLSIVIYLTQLKIFSGFVLERCLPTLSFYHHSTQSQSIYVPVDQAPDQYLVLKLEVQSGSLFLCTRLEVCRDSHSLHQTSSLFSHQSIQTQQQVSCRVWYWLQMGY
ncbi:uncharacterized protein [Cicer arietinum]|uniref:Uncharacterized protein LOC105851821 n=1 Tax=Cicer arietinum TaxID=3827 RepID=A0A3Q7XWM9_CICAR|nr:uncharacterized protein LOC105851821 [Cicer arietinum]